MGLNISLQLSQFVWGVPWLFQMLLAGKCRRGFSLFWLVLFRLIGTLFTIGVSLIGSRRIVGWETSFLLPTKEYITSQLWVYTKFIYSLYSLCLCLYLINYIDCRHWTCYWDSLGYKRCWVSHLLDYIDKQQLHLLQVLKSFVVEYGVFSGIYLELTLIEYSPLCFAVFNWWFEKSGWRTNIWTMWASTELSSQSHCLSITTKMKTRMNKTSQQPIWLMSLQLLYIYLFLVYKKYLLRWRLEIWWFSLHTPNKERWESCPPILADLLWPQQVDKVWTVKIETLFRFLSFVTFFLVLCRFLSPCL